MKYDDITKIITPDNLSINSIIEMVRSSNSDYVLLSDASYDFISCGDIDLSPNDFIIPSIVPFNDKVSGPFGKLLKNIHIESNLTVQPFVSQAIKNDFLPFAFIAHKDSLVELLEQCQYCVFLELSLLIMANPKYSVKNADDWLASVALRQETEEVRSKLSVRFGTMYSLIKPCPEHVDRVFDLSKHTSFQLNKHIKTFGGQNIILTDKDTAYLDTLMYNNVVVSVNCKVPADWYIALDEETINGADWSKTISQLVVPTVNNRYPIDLRYCKVSSVFGVKQFSSDVSFEPPFTKSTYKILTALEILCFFKPLSILVISDEFIMCLFAHGDSPEAIKKQVFTTKIMEYCLTNNINLRVLGDVCTMK